VLQRCWDRGCGFQLKRDEDDVHTKKLLETDLENLYTGSEIQAFYVYAQYFTALWAIMSYSGGLPALYPVGCLNFFILYWAYKILLLKHYKKTTAFDAQLPILSMNKFRVALVLHIAFSLFMFSNSNILSAKNLVYI